MTRPPAILSSVLSVSSLLCILTTFAFLLTFHFSVISGFHVYFVLIELVSDCQDCVFPSAHLYNCPLIHDGFNTREHFANAAVTLLAGRLPSCIWFDAPEQSQLKVLRHFSASLQRWFPKSLVRRCRIWLRLFFRLAVCWR